jgi:hypothetical protein
MSETCSLDPSAHHQCSSRRSAAAWRAAVAGQTHRDARPCERSQPSRPRRQHHSGDAAAGQYVDPWRGC